MIGRTLVRPLEDDWRGTLDVVARARHWPESGDVRRLAASVAALSAAYNQRGTTGSEGTRSRAADALLGARLGFSFVRDVPKAAAAVRELVAAGALKMPTDRALRVLDVGAGLGATTWGVLRALEAAGARGAIEATFVDADAAALDVAMRIVAERRRTPSPIALEATPSRGTAHGAALGTTFALEPMFDLVLMGQVLSELDLGAPEIERVEKHAALVRALLKRLEPSGAIVIVEPALRERTRHLHRVRDLLLSEVDAAAPSLFAPCLHAERCPALAREDDWCHEDVTVDLPSWLVPVARAAGLRYQGLTFSYLVLRKPHEGTLARVLAGDGAKLRVVSDVFVTKGKREVFLCGEIDGIRARVMRLDRDATAFNSAWDKMQRGEVLAISPSPEAGPQARTSKTPRVRAAGVVRAAELVAEATSPRAWEHAPACRPAT